MNAIDPIIRLHEHRTWVNHKLLDAANQLSDEQLHRSFKIGQGSIWRTLTHLYGGEYVWLAALNGDEQPLVPGDLPDKLPGNQAADNAMTSLGELTSNWNVLEERWQSYIAGLTAESLDELVFKTSTSSGRGKRYGIRRLDVLLHVCTHAHYTTAQVINMMRHVGVERLPDSMLITLARSEAV